MKKLNPFLILILVIMVNGLMIRKEVSFMFVLVEEIIKNMK